MAITDKNRKILWGRSGNRCAICKKELVIDATPVNAESVVGDECHIISSQVQGPRYDPTFLPEKVDLYDNLILLCRVHHKMIDDQCDTYTTDILRHMKANHEKWVSEKLSGLDAQQPPRLKRILQNIPDYLVRLTTGNAVFNIVNGACSYSFDHDELENPTEVELVGAFLQTAQDWGDLGPELEAGERVRTGFELTQFLKELEDAGFVVFGGQEDQILEGGGTGPSCWPVAILQVLRKTNESIIKLQLGTPETDDVQ